MARPDGGMDFQVVGREDGAVGQLHPLVILNLMTDYIGACLKQQLQHAAQNQVMAATAGQIPT